MTVHLKPSFLTSIAFETDDGKHLRMCNFSKLNEGINFNQYPIESTDILIGYKKKTIADNNNIPMIPELKDYFVYCYKIGNQLSNFLTLYQNYGIPLVHSSFDFYCFLVSLLCEDSFHDTFMENEGLQSIWYSLWKTSEYEAMMEHLNKLRTYDTVTNEQLVKFVSSYHLRTDALKHFWDCIN